MGGHIVKDRKERLSFLLPSPMSFGTGFVPTRLHQSRRIRRVVVGLHIVRGVVANLSQILGKPTRPLGQRMGRTHLTGPGGRGIQSRDETRARRGTHRISGKGMSVKNTFLGQSIDVWRHRIRITIAAQSRTHILGDNPKNIRALDLALSVEEIDRLPVCQTHSHQKYDDQFHPDIPLQSSSDIQSIIHTHSRFKIRVPRERKADAEKHW